MDLIERRRRILVITRRLIVLAALSLLVVMLIFGTIFYLQDRLMLTWVAFECGIIGGFVSIQQRLKNIDNDELYLISESWFSILLIPVYGGIFALVLYMLFLSQLLSGQLFPAFWVPVFDDVPTTANVKALLFDTKPLTAADLPKFVFWSFAAGFSERLVPQIIQKFSDQAAAQDKASPIPAVDEPAGGR